MGFSLTFIDLAGFIALLLWGTHMVQTGIQRAFGARLRSVLGHALRVKAALDRWTNPGYYLNFAEHKVDTAASFGAFTYRRLQAVKHRLDPEAVIHANHAL